MGIFTSRPADEQSARDEIAQAIPDDERGAAGMKRVRLTPETMYAISSVLEADDTLEKICSQYTGHLKHIPTKSMYNACVKTRKRIITNFLDAKLIDHDGLVANMLKDGGPGLSIPLRKSYFMWHYTIPTTPLYLRSDPSRKWGFDFEDYKMILMTANTKMMANLDLYLYRDIYEGIKRLLRLPVKLFDKITIIFDIDNLDPVLPIHRNVIDVERYLGFKLRANRVERAASFTGIVPGIRSLWDNPYMNTLYLEPIDPSSGITIDQMLLVQLVAVSSTPEHKYIGRITFNYETPYEHILQVMLVNIGMRNSLPTDVFVRNRPARQINKLYVSNVIWAEGERLTNDIRRALAEHSDDLMCECVSDQYHTHIHFIQPPRKFFGFFALRADAEPLVERIRQLSATYESTNSVGNP